MILVLEPTFGRNLKTDPSKVPFSFSFIEVALNDLALINVTLISGARNSVRAFSIFLRLTPKILTPFFHKFASMLEIPAEPSF
jgi:hypothetical protein